MPKALLDVVGILPEELVGKIDTEPGVSSALPRNRYKDRVRLDRNTDASPQSTDTTPVSKTPLRYTGNPSARLTLSLTNLSDSGCTSLSHSKHPNTHKLEGTRITKPSNPLKSGYQNHSPKCTHKTNSRVGTRITPQTYTQNTLKSGYRNQSPK
jgi:hypothetical protein